MAKAKRKSTSGKRRKSKKSSNSQDLNLNIIGTIILVFYLQYYYTQILEP